jgi:hypothetical protein
MVPKVVRYFLFTTVPYKDSPEFVVRKMDLLALLFNDVSVFTFQLMSVR